MFILVYISPLFDTPSASRTILTSQTLQYSNTAVTVSPPLTPRIGPLDRYVNRNLLFPWGRPGGEPEEGNDTKASHNIDTVTQLNTLTMEFKANVILRIDTQVVSLISGD